MGDFERIFGAGADVLKIIDGFKHDDNRKDGCVKFGYYERVNFYTLEGAEEFCVDYPGGHIERFTCGFIGGRIPDRHASHVVISDDSEGFFIPENYMQHNKDVVGMILKKFKIDIIYTPNKKLDALVRKLFGKRLLCGGILNKNLLRKLVYNQPYPLSFIHVPPRKYADISTALIESGYICHTLSQDVFVVFKENGSMWGMFENSHGCTLCFVSDILIRDFIPKSSCTPFFVYL